MVKLPQMHKGTYWSIYYLYDKGKYEFFIVAQIFVAKNCWLLTNFSVHYLMGERQFGHMLWLMSHKASWTELTFN